MISSLAFFYFALISSLAFLTKAVKKRLQKRPLIRVMLKKVVGCITMDMFEGFEIQIHDVNKTKIQRKLKGVAMKPLHCIGFFSSRR